MASQDRLLRFRERSRTEDHLVPTHVNTHHDAMSVADTRHPQRKRASKPKVRTGCTTCKIRRVKCDETKPSCNRCTSTGRKCDGYQFSREHTYPWEALPAPPPEPQASQSQLFLPSSISVTFPGDAKERRIFHRFQVCTVPAFAGSSELQFWESLVLQVGQQEPVVRSAIVALGTLHEDYQWRKGKYSQDLINDPSYQQALSLYGKALRQLNERLYEADRTSAKLALISSILFTCFEVLRRNNMAAIVHYQAGLRELIRQIENSRKNEEAAASSQSSSAVTQFQPAPQDDLHVLLRVFARYDIQACTFAKPQAETVAVTLSPQPPPFRTITEVRIHLDNLLISVYQLIKSDRSMYRYWQSENVPTDWLLHRDNAITIFENWLSAIEEFFRTSTVALRPHDLKTLLGLRMQVKVALIQLKTCVDSAPEMSFDVFLAEFDQIVTRVEDLADSLALREALPLDDESTAFTMELGILHPLFFVATKCRDWTVRRRAVTALKRGGREGVWEGPIVALVAERMIEIEEAGLEPGDTIPERHRIHDVRKDVDYDGRQVLVEARRSIDQQEWKQWEVIRESIKF